MKILLRLKYAGTGYAGFQFQPNAVTVQGELTKAMSDLFGEKCDVSGCSRTDSGVHANEFVCSVVPHEKGTFPEDFSFPAGKIHRASVKYLPPDIAVCGAAYVGDDFHPRYSAVGKEYVYKILNSVSPNPFFIDRALYVPYHISDEDITRMNECAREFVGEKDFFAFMASGSDIKDTVRNVFEAKVEKNGEIITFTVSANGFLYNMVRIMTGTLLDCARGRITAEQIVRAVDTKDRTLLGQTAPACGLYLNRVFYQEQIHWLAE